MAWRQSYTGFLPARRILQSCAAETLAMSVGETHLKHAFPFAMPTMSIADTPEVIPVCTSAIT
jgi:hypothetical protein